MDRQVMARRKSQSLTAQGQGVLSPTSDVWRFVETPGAVERDEAEWISHGKALGQIERRVMWEIGDWWNRGIAYGRRVEIVSDPGWTGPSYKTCRNAGQVAARFEVSRRRDTLTFSHYAEVVSLPGNEAEKLLAQAEREAIDSGEIPGTRQLRQNAKRERRDIRERLLTENTREASVAAGRKLYSVILADPPWRFTPWSVASGMDRAADNHYPTMALEDICTLDVPAADDCVLFLWRTAPMCHKAMQTMEAWGFEYRTELVWAKDRIGTGYWFRNQHEVLMVGVKGHPPAPAPGEQFPSLQMGKVLAHSEKPGLFYDIIEEMFPTADRLEMFARSRRLGWDAWGFEA